MLNEVAELGRQRVVDNTVGGLRAIIAVSIAIGYSQWSTRWGGETESHSELQDVLTLSPAGSNSAAHRSAGNAP